MGTRPLQHRRRDPNGGAHALGGGPTTYRLPVELELFLHRGLRVQLGEVRVAPNEDSAEKMFGGPEVSILLRIVPRSHCAGGALQGSVRGHDARRAVGSKRAVIMLWTMFH